MFYRWGVGSRRRPPAGGWPSGIETVPLRDHAEEAPKLARDGIDVVRPETGIPVRAWITQRQSGEARVDGEAIGWAGRQILVRYISREGRRGGRGSGPTPSSVAEPRRDEPRPAGADFSGRRNTRPTEAIVGFPLSTLCHGSELYRTAAGCQGPALARRRAGNGGTSRHADGREGDPPGRQSGAAAPSYLRVCLTSSTATVATTAMPRMIPPIRIAAVAFITSPCLLGARLAPAVAVAHSRP